MKILLTGATGFVGSHLADLLVSRGHQVQALVRRSSKSESLTQKGIELVYGDLSGTDLVQLPDVDAVIHVAGLIKAKHVAEYYQVNAEGTRTLLKAYAGRELKKFILVSSLAARGPNASAADTLGIGPVSHYGKSKLAAEDIVLMSLPHDKVVIFRPPVVYGPGDAATLTLFKMFRRGVFPVLGDGENRVSFIYIADLCAGIAAAIEQSVRNYGPFYPDDGKEGYSWNEVARLAEGLYGRRIRTPALPLALAGFAARGSELAGKLFNFVPMLSRDKFTEMKHAYWFCSSNSLIKAYPVPKPTLLAEGLKLAKDWYEAHRWL